MLTDIGSPKVSIVCAWYNRADYIEETLSSLLAQDFDSYEIIIANDGSTDPRVQQMLDSYDDARLKVIHKKNEGFTKTISMLIGLARAPYVAIQGAGEVSMKNRIALQYAFLSTNPNCGMVGSSSINIIKRHGRPDEVLKENKLEHGYVGFCATREKLPFTHGSAMYNKQAYFGVGGYREIFKYAQDYDLFLRMVETYKCFSLSESLYLRNVFLDGVSTSAVKSFEQAMFVKFANRCFHLRRELGVDIIDRYGVMAFMLYQFDTQDTKSIIKAFFKLIYLEDIPEARRFAALLGRGLLPFLLKLFVSLIDKSSIAKKSFFFLIKKKYKSSVFIKSND